MTDVVKEPAGSAGLITVTLESLRSTTVAGNPPNVTVDTSAKFAPLIVTRVPPETGPLVGDTEVTTGSRDSLTKVKVPGAVTVPREDVTDTA